MIAFEKSGVTGCKTLNGLVKAMSGATTISLGLGDFENLWNRQSEVIIEPNWMIFVVGFHFLHLRIEWVRFLI